MSDDPFTKYPSKLKDIKKRDFLVKQLKREREELHYERQRQLQLEQDEEPEEVVPIRGARAIVIVKDSYLSRNLSSFNHSVHKDSLPKKWSKKQHEEEQRRKEEEDEDDDEDYEDEDYDDEDNELDDDDDDVDANVAKLKIDKPVLAPSQSQKKLPTHEESDDDDEDELRLTQKKVVQFIEAFNEIEIIDCELNPNAKDTDDYNEAKTIAPQRMIRDKSKSPGFHAKTTPKSTHKAIDDTTVPSLDLGKNASTKSPYMKPTENEKKQKDLLQQMEDLDLASLTKPKSQDELSILPHPDELDTGVWWKYILDHGAIITKDGKFDIRVVDFFPPAKQHDIPESYFHLPPGRKSAPEKPLTAFGLFKKHQIAENPELIKQTNHSKRNRSKHSASDAQLKDMFHALPEDDILDYLALALCEKLRYKCQRAEYIYSQSTHMSQSKKERSTHKK